MQEALHLGPVAWGWVTGIFTIAYAAFEIPSGALGDRIGPRRVLTRVVLWWSVFTSLTGMVTGFYSLLAARFLFGAGEAGAFPNASVAMSRWFPVEERGRAFGIWLMASQVGGAIAPVLVVPIQAHYGWRASFYVFGILGVAWSVVWYRWFRDSPAEKAGVTQQELEETKGLTAPSHHAPPWRLALRSRSLWALMGAAFSCVYTYSFFQSWLHTYLVKAHGYSQNDLLLSSLPYIVGALANLTGGLASGALLKRMGLKAARCWLGAGALGISAVCAIAVPFVGHWLWALVLLSIVYGAIAFQQPAMFAVCLDIGGDHGGAATGAMNSAAQAGSFVSSIAFGYLVEHYGNYNVPFIPMAALLVLGAWLWLKIDPTRSVTPA